MKLKLEDRISFDAVGMRETADGYLVTNPRVARTGIQLYRGSEIGGKFKDQKVVRVYRAPEEVFNKDSMHSYAFKPLTNDHPPVEVNANNWKDYSVGQAGGEIAKDGECVRVPMVFMDAGAIKAINGGKKQLSVGYTCDIKDEAGTTPNGEAFDCSQHNIFVNHIALVKAARGGDRLSVGDADAMPALVCDGAVVVSAATLLAAGKVSKDVDGEANLFLAPGYPIGRTDALSTACLERTRDAATAAGEEHVADTAKALLDAITQDGNKEHTMPKLLMIDGVNVEFVSDQSAQIAERAIQTRDAALKDANEALAKLKKEKEEKESKDAATITTQKTQVDTLTAENTTLKAQVADAMSPAKMDAAITERATVFGKAKTLLGGTVSFDGKTVSEVKRMVVDSVVKDGAKGWSDEQVAISFATLTANTVADGSTATLDARTAFNHQGGFVHRSTDAENALEQKYAARDKALENAWQTPMGTAAVRQ